MRKWSHGSLRVCLLLKKLSLDPTAMDHFCPVSNLPFFRKVIEKMVSLPPQMFLTETDYLDLLKLEFKARYGLEMALVIFFNDLWQEQDGDSASYCICPALALTWPLSSFWYYLVFWILLEWLGSWELGALCGPGLFPFSKHVFTQCWLGARDLTLGPCLWSPSKVRAVSIPV